MPRKISIREKREWLEMYEQGKTEAQISKELRRDQRTIAKGIEEAGKERQLINAETEMLRNALFDHQDQLKVILRNIQSMLVMPPHNLELREEEGSDVPATIHIPKARIEPASGDQMSLIINDEDKLEWEMLQEHLKQDKLWALLKQWRKAMEEYTQALWIFRKQVKYFLDEAGKTQDEEQTQYPIPEVSFMSEVAIKRILDIPDKTDLEPSYGDKAVSILTKLPDIFEATKVKITHEALDKITKSTKRGVDEILLLGMVTGKCRVCRRLGK